MARAPWTARLNITNDFERKHPSIYAFLFLDVSIYQILSTLKTIIVSPSMSYMLHFHPSNGNLIFQTDRKRSPSPPLTPNPTSLCVRRHDINVLFDLMQTTKNAPKNLFR